MARCDRCGREGSAQFGTAYNDQGERVLACSNGRACKKRRAAAEEVGGDDD